MSFLDKQFPADISFGAVGGPQESTNIVVLGSGSESRRARWADAGGSWNVATGIKNDSDLQDLIAFFRVARGSFRGFRFKDWLDYTSGIRNIAETDADQNIGTGDGSQTAFQITKDYLVDGETIKRTILKPVVGTVLLAVNSVSKTEGIDFIVDYSLGVVHIFVAPPNGHSVTVGFQFDTPVRFKSDKLDVTGLTTKSSRAQAITVVELKPIEVIGIDIDFTSMTTAVLPDSRLTLVRASQGSYFNSAGVLKFALNNEPRPGFEHIAPFTHNGILIEEPRTIRITKNRDMSDAAWSATNMAVTKDAIGLDGVVNSASTLTASAANGTVTQTPTLSSLERTYSVWVKRKTGSGTVEITDNNFTNVLDITGSINTSTFTKFEIVRTQANPAVGIRIVTSTDAVEVDFNQVEDGDFATSPIDSDIFTVRQGDALSFNDTSWINNVQGTIWVECSLPDNIRSGIYTAIAEMYDGSSINNNIILSKNQITDKAKSFLNNSVTNIAIADTKVWSADTVRTLIFDYESGDQAFFTDGTSEGTDTEATMPTGMDTMLLGKVDDGHGAPAGGSFLNGHIKRFKYIPVATLG